MYTILIILYENSLQDQNSVWWQALSLIFLFISQFNRYKTLQDGGRSCMLGKKHRRIFNFLLESKTNLLRDQLFCILIVQIDDATLTSNDFVIPEKENAVRSLLKRRLNSEYAMQYWIQYLEEKITQKLASEIKAITP